MNDTDAFRGSLFAGDFLRDTIVTSAEWRAFDDGALEAFARDVEALFARFADAAEPNEAQTGDDLIWPVLERLGWTASLRQQNLSPRGRGDVPDGLLFADDAAKRRANRFAETWRRYEHGIAIVEAKRWRLPLDRRTEANGPEAPASTQMLRYLRRVDEVTSGKLRWGILTDGAVWRLYYQGARSVSEEFFELDLAALAGAGGFSDEERRHWLKVFALIFGREAFLPGAADARTFHRRAIDEGRFYQERVAADISRLIFERVFPSLARAIAAAAPAAPLPEVREAALIVLYRLLFLFYAEDRGLLPVRDPRYAEYGVRENLREIVGKVTDRKSGVSELRARYWGVLDDLSRAIDRGDPALGLPPYNGGLFDRERVPVLAQIRIPDATMAEIVDALSFERTLKGLRRYVNYRDLGVQQLGSIYERLLEREVVRENGAVVVRPNRFARKDSGSFYTPDDLVGLIVSETLDPLVRRRIDAFENKAAELRASGAPRERRLAELRPLDPAERLVELRVCDPAMGSGHFLVAATDYLTDRIVACMAEAEGAAEGYVSLLMERVEAVRETILRNAEAGGWAIDAERLDDRHIVRRMALKRCVFGVDKNPMAVELAKVTLWLHTFTAGAPLSFLDHHLRCGDSLFGSWVRGGLDRAEAHGNALFPVDSLRRAREELEDKEGAWPVRGNRFSGPSGDWVPLYEGKMVQAYDHRAANVVFNPENLHRPAQPLPTTAEQHADPGWSPNPLYWISKKCTGLGDETFLVAFKHVTAPTNIRTMIAALLPCAGAGNSLPLLLGSGDMTAKDAAPIVANLNAVPLDYIARQKVQGQNLNWFVVEQLPVVPLERFDEARFGPKTAGEIVRDAVLELTYTAHDMAPFARDMGYMDESGAAKPPFAWNERRRLELRAKLDALFFHFYGITDRDDIRYIYSTFPIVERDETKAYGRYLSRDLCLAWANALAAGQPDADVTVRGAR